MDGARVIKQVEPTKIHNLYIRLLKALGVLLNHVDVSVIHSEKMSA